MMKQALLTAVLSQLMSSPRSFPAHYGYSYPVQRAPYGIAKSRRAAKKRANIRKHK